MSEKATLADADLARLVAAGKSLYVDGIEVTSMHSNRLVARLSGARFDAASLVYFLNRGIWPRTLPQFLDGDKTNLAFKNLVLSSCRTDPDLMLAQHQRAQRQEVYGTAEPCGVKYGKASTGKMGRPRIHARQGPEPVAGREWRKFRGHWVAVEPAAGVWDDFQVRALRVLESGNYLHICPIKA